MSGRPVKVAAGIAFVVFLGMVVFLRMRNYVPFVAALATFAIAWLAMLPPRRTDDARVAGPDTEGTRAVAELDQAARRLERLSRRAPAADRPLFQRMADLMAQIRDQHRKNPDHAELTKRFRRHVVGRMVDAVDNYVELALRAGPGQKERLAAISTQLEAFVPVLERIDRACFDNDLMALEINVEVLNEQLNRRP